ncbi:rRNA maturation RNase YbeY [Limibacillus sp. MBR-115]|jgi:probable rRNA maturation factor|uniref:rRNA maturation RNase YbeY n=1 Tax=Limibacillus sp. MBR-115 TaxID=3156465 RepID=UPI00339B40E9
MNDDPDSSIDSPVLLELDIVFHSGDWQAKIGSVEEDAKQAVTETLWTEQRISDSQQVAAEICICLADDPFLQDLNARYRGKDQPTNVLSFPQFDLHAQDAPPSMPLGAGPLLLGDIVLSLDTLQREAAADGKALRDHFLHLVVHGTLHLLGHDHEAPEQATAMESLERRILARLGVSDPYLDESEPAALAARNVM